MRWFMAADAIGTLINSITSEKAVHVVVDGQRAFDIVPGGLERICPV